MVKVVCPLLLGLLAWRFAKWVRDFEIDWDLPFENETQYEPEWTWN